jgi:hypothetical protein
MTRKAKRNKGEGMSFKTAVAAILGIEPQEREVVRYVDRAVPEPVEVVRLIEVPVLKTLPGWNKEQREMVATLASDPRFQLLTERLNFQCQTLKAKLNGERHKLLSDVEFIQSGIFWSKWLQNECDKVTNRVIIRQMDAQKEDLEAIAQLETTYEHIGGE